jgi:hypothetical protein
MKVTFVDGSIPSIKIVLDSEFENREVALTKMDEVHKEFKRLYPEHVVLVMLKDSTSDVYILR